MSISRTATGGMVAPSGVVTQHTSTIVPSGWLLCDGSAVSRSVYAALFATISTTYGSGDGSTTFNLPDLRGRTAVGSGTGTASGATAKTLGSTPTSGAGGEETHLLTGAESGTSVHGGHSISGTHTHTQSGHTHTYLDRYPNGWYGAASGSDSTGWQADLRADTTRTTATQNTGGGAGANTNQAASTGITATGTSTAADAGSAHNIMQPHTVLNFIIKT